MSETVRKWYIDLYDGTAWDTREQAERHDHSLVVEVVCSDALAAVEHERDSLRAQLDTAQEELAAVRRVEEWRAARSFERSYTVSTLGARATEVRDYMWQQVAHADSLAALGRLLAEGDDATT